MADIQIEVVWPRETSVGVELASLPGARGPAGSPGDPLVAAVQDALDALPPYDGGAKRTVTVAPGDYVVSEPIRVPSGVLLDLARGARLTLADGANCDVITNADWVNGNTDIEIRGGYLDGNRTGQVSVVGDGPGQSLISLVNVARFRVDGVEGTSPFLHGVDMNVRDLSDNSYGDPGCSDGIVANCRFTDFGDDGISPHWSRGISIVACENWGAAGTYSTSSNGIECDDGSSDITITGCVSHDVVNGVMVQGHAGRVPGRRVTINGQVSYNCSRSGVTVAQPSATNADEPGRGVFINGLIVKDCYIGIQVENYRGVRAQGVHLENVTNAIYVNESVAGTVSGIEIAGGEMMGVIGNKVVYGGTATAEKARVELAGGPFSDSLWLPAEKWLPQAGAPETAPVGPAGREMACWMLDPAVGESLHAVATLPGHWEWIHAEVWWLNPSGAAGSAVWRLNRSFFTPGAVIAGESAGGLIVADAAAQNVVASKQVLINSPLTQGAMLRLELERVADDAADTFPDDAAILGVVIRRAR